MVAALIGEIRVDCHYSLLYMWDIHSLAPSFFAAVLPPPQHLEGERCQEMLLLLQTVHCKLYILIALTGF